MKKALKKMQGKETNVTDDLRNLYEVEDAIDSFALRIKCQRKRMGFLMNHALLLKNFTACKKLSRKLKKIQKKIVAPNDQKPGDVENASLRSNCSYQNYEQNEAQINSNDMTLPGKSFIIRERWEQGKFMFSSFSDEQELHNVGFERDVPDLVKRLTEEDNRIISLVGEMGSGKTTLARAVYGNRRIKDHFKSRCCAWIAISKDSSTKDVLLNLLKQVGESRDQDGELTEQMLQTRVWERLKDRKFLIVLDGVWSSELWKNLKNAFPDEENGSKIILTTRDEQVAKKAFPKSLLHSMKKLDEEESWNLFLHKPLSTKKDKGYEEWVPILNRLENGQTSDIVSLCYDDLDAHPKLCLLYLMLFPQEYDISIRRLLRLWLAEGFVKRPEKQDVLQEDEVKKYFDNLVIRSLIQVSKLRSDGSPRKCRLLGVLRDSLLDKARDIRLFHVHVHPHDEVAASDIVRGPVEYADANNCSLDRSKFPYLHSYVSFNFQKKDIPATGVGNLLSNMIGKGFGLLRVLDLEGVYKPRLPNNLGDLFLLRYLGLRWTFLDKLPKSVGDLPYLETLDLKHTYINRIPTSIWKLKHLQHLDLNEISLDKEMPLHRSGSLPPLLTLRGLSVDPESPVNKCLSKLTQLRELGISFRLNNPDDNLSQAMSGSRKYLLEWISNLTNLESLRLRSKDDNGRPSELGLQPLSALVKLSNLNLLGKLQTLPEVCQFPPNIKVLTLSVSQLVDDPIPTLGELRSLTVLRLLANSYTGKKIVCPRNTFAELRVLKLWMLKDLKEWEWKKEQWRNFRSSISDVVQIWIAFPAGCFKRGF
ncbi:probable disease resistance RF45 [Olea europaea subsp. europaea]|uniref:Probable disease resistance RF45 n=1 Tax=Olea europaea subsp. europaea TaxID=158383 RepID=A0A8S0RSX3_OLEEU|nr:probable disease resistance RF45 [Olea europaea subsp. europaea]